MRRAHPVRAASAPDRAPAPGSGSGGRAVRWRRRAGVARAEREPLRDRLASSLAGLSLLRMAALGAATATAISSQGDVVVLALLLGLAAGRVSSGAAAAGTAAAVLLRWGSPSLGALAGAQSVLGPAGTTGTTAAAASAWLAAGALALAATPARGPRPSGGRLARLGFVAPALPFGLAAAAVVAGPGPDGLGLRVAASSGAVLLAALVAAARATPGTDRAAAAAAVALGVAAALAAGGS